MLGEDFFFDTRWSPRTGVTGVRDLEARLGFEGVDGGVAGGEEGVSKGRFVFSLPSSDRSSAPEIAAPSGRRLCTSFWLCGTGATL